MVRYRRQERSWAQSNEQLRVRCGNRRWIQLFVDLKERLESIRDSIPDSEFYSSEEFQTLLALAYEQLSGQLMVRKS
jgi:hypothetical protein